MAAPVNPTGTGFAVGFYQMAQDMIVILSNLSLPVSGDASQTGVISGTSATVVIAALVAQQALL